MSEHEKLRSAIERVLAITGPNASDDLYRICKAAESTLPRTKMVEVWRVEYAKRWPTFDGAEWMPCVYQYMSRSMADDTATGIAKDAWPKTCIRVTGPHMQEVPCP